MGSIRDELEARDLKKQAKWEKRSKGGGGETAMNTEDAYRSGPGYGGMRSMREETGYPE